MNFELLFSAMTRPKPISFMVVFSICILLELTRSKFKHNYTKRFFLNFSLLILGILFVNRILPHQLKMIMRLPILPWGTWLLPPLIGIPLSIIILDFLIYWQHRLFHKIPVLWKIHKIHHSDTSMDLSTGFRFHPLEILLSALYKVFFVILLGIPYQYFVLYEIVLFSMAIFNHSNFVIPKKLDRALRLLIVTPEMHYPHHHPDVNNTNTNFGNFLSLWDRLFKSYNEKYTSEFGVDGMVAGQEKSLKYLLFFLK